METRLNKDQAIEEALAIQSDLYGSLATYLRTTKNFPSERYKEISLSLETQKKVEYILENLPEDKSARFDILNSLCKKFSVESIKSLWENIHLRNAPKSKDFKKFYDYSRVVFEDPEKNYSPLDVQTEFIFSPPSSSYSVLAYLMYKKLGGEAYLSPQELAYNFSKAVRGKKILELAPGPGWFLSVLKHHGAEVSGLEKDDTTNYVGRALNLNIQYDDLKNATQIYQPESFDLVISNNLLSPVSISGKEEGKNAVAVSEHLIKPGGHSINCNQHLPPKPYELIMLLAREIPTLKIKDVPEEEFKEMVINRVIPEKKITKLSGEELILEPKDVKNMGLKNAEFGREYHMDFFQFDK